MNELNKNLLNDEELTDVSGGRGRGRGEAAGSDVTPVTPYWVRVTASSLNCRYRPSMDAEIAKIYEKGHKLKIDGRTNDNKWYRLLIYDPRSTNGGVCYGYIYKAYTERIQQ